MPPASSAPHRSRSGETTKRTMLAAARRRFLQESYENVSLRDIAADAGVDVALVGRYFGNKEGLFRDVLGGARDKEILPSHLQDIEIPAYLSARLLSDDEEANESFERLLIIVRSAGSPAASQLVAEALQKDVLLPFEKRLGGSRADVRASACMAVWMGMTIMRTVISVEAMGERSPAVEAKVKLLFEAALSEQ